MANPVEIWKAEKHGFDVWGDVERYAAAGTAMKDIDSADLERMKWHGFFYRKRDTPGRYMNRIRVTANELSAEQAREIAYIAYEYGHGIIDVTTRANLQVQGLEIADVPKFAQRLEKVGLTSKQTGHDNIRNVFGHALSGLMADELIDTRGLCHDIVSMFLGSRIYSDLPRKMNIAMSGASQHSAQFWTQDISYLATRTEQGEIAFSVLIGGTQGQNPHLAWHLPVLVRPNEVVDVTRAVLDLFRVKGSRESRGAARLRYLIERIGVDGVLAWLEQNLSFRLQPCATEPVPASSYDEMIGWFRQRDADMWTMGLCVPLGRMSWQQLEGLAVLSRKWGDGSLRTTHEQGMAVINIPTGFKDAAATAAAALGLSVQVDALESNTMACTGSQFCNIAVTETKGHMFQLIEKLRKKALKLHGIRIHMSGCPSSCAQHFTADIGLKGVRVRRLLGTREGFDVFLGGGLAGQVHMALPYRLGVDVDQLPTLVEEVVRDYYLRHEPGQTFSAYWRERLSAAAAEKVGDGEYTPPVWICEKCDHRHSGEDPPVFCPSCAGLRRYYARLEEGGASRQEDGLADDLPARTDGFQFATKVAALADAGGVTVQVQGKEYALFRDGEKFFAIDSACPHEGARLADGEMKGGVVTCPWHGWTFNACTGCSIEPRGNDVKRYETLVEDGNVFIKVDVSAIAAQTSRPHVAVKSQNRLAQPAVASLKVLEVIQETPDVRTFRLDNSGGELPLGLPGQFARVCVPIGEREVWRSFTISSSPRETRFVDLTIKRNPGGEVSNFLFDNVAAGGVIKLKGPQGGFYFDPERHTEPLVLVSAGSGITPMMSIARFLRDASMDRGCEFLYCARTAADIIFHEECLELAQQRPAIQYYVTLSQPGDGWPGPCGRLDFERVRQLVPDLRAGRYFLCGPNDFMDVMQQGLRATGVPHDRIHTEMFATAPQTAPAVAVA